MRAFLGLFLFFFKVLEPSLLAFLVTCEGVCELLLDVVVGFLEDLFLLVLDFFFEFIFDLFLYLGRDGDLLFSVCKWLLDGLCLAGLCLTGLADFFGLFNDWLGF